VGGRHTYREWSNGVLSESKLPLLAMATCKNYGDDTRCEEEKQQQQKPKKRRKEAEEETGWRRTA
jgi:hypothetical protein